MVQHQKYYLSKQNIDRANFIRKTAQHKASLIEGKIMIDLTGGFGVDDDYFAKNFDKMLLIANE